MSSPSESVAVQDGVFVAREGQATKGPLKVRALLLGLVKFTVWTVYKFLLLKPTIVDYQIQQCLASRLAELSVQHSELIIINNLLFIRRKIAFKYRI